MRRLALTATLLLLAGSCGRPAPAPESPGQETPGVVILDAIATGSPLGKAGLAPGDALLAWRRDERGGAFDGFDDLWELEREEAPRGAVTLTVERSGTRLEAAVPEGRWQATARPALAPGELDLDRQAQRAIEQDDRPAALAPLTALRSGTMEPEVRAWASWRLALLRSQESDADWDHALEAALAAGDQGLEAWLAGERCFEQTRVGAFATAQPACERALALREALGQPLAAAEIEYRLAWLAGRRGDPREEERRFRHLVERLEELAPGCLLQARSLHNLAKARATQDDLTEAFAHARRALELAIARAPGGLDHQASVQLLGIFHWFAEEWEAAEARLGEALAMLQAIDPEHEDVANVLNNLGIVASDRGDLTSAEEYYRRSLAVRERVAPDPLQASRTLNNLANLALVRGDFATAVRLERRVLALRQSLAPDSIDVATALLNLGSNLVEAGEPVEGERHLGAALDLQRRHVPGSRDVAMSLLALAELERSRDAAAPAEVHLDEALAITGRTAPASVLEARILREVGELRAAAGAAPEAERHLRRSTSLLESLVPGTLQHALSLHALGRLQRAAGRREEALASLTAAARALETQLGTLGGSDEVRARFRESWRHIHRDLVDLLRELGRPEEAFEELERSRARAFLLLLRAREVEVETAPRLGTLAATLDLGAARRALGPTRAAISYAVDEETTHAWVIAPDGELHHRDLGVGAAELRDLVDRFRLLCEAPAAAGEPEHLGARLYDLLLAPAEEELAAAERLLIVPDGPLHHLPFAALVRRGEEGVIRHLVEWKPIQLAASLTTWAELQNREDAPGRRFVAFADPEPGGAADSRDAAGNGQGPRLARLPRGRAEATSAAELFAPDAVVLAGRAATETAAKRVGREARFVHFATHAYVDPLSPLDSALVLAPAAPPAGGPHDGLLQAWEVVQELTLDAELVVLSGCQTGSGPAVGDEGILGLTRAFQFAGARAVLSSLWRISDRATALLMESFYRELSAGRPADEALRRAQLALLRGTVRSPGLPAWVVGLWPGGEAASEWAHPSSWAAFHLYGAV